MVLINRRVDEKIICPLSGLPGKQSDKQVVCVCVLGAGSQRRGWCTVKGLWETASLCVLYASGGSEFAFESLFCAAFPVGTVINEDINGETQRRRFP